jgi:hypothetical protein
MPHSWTHAHLDLVPFAEAGCHAHAVVTSARPTPVAAGDGPGRPVRTTTGVRPAAFAHGPDRQRLAVGSTGRNTSKQPRGG